MSLANASGFDETRNFKTWLSDRDLGPIPKTCPKANDVIILLTRVWGKPF